MDISEWTVYLQGFKVPFWKILCRCTYRISSIEWERGQGKELLTISMELVGMGLLYCLQVVHRLIARQLLRACCRGSLCFHACLYIIKQSKSYRRTLVWNYFMKLLPGHITAPKPDDPKIEFAIIGLRQRSPRKEVFFFLMVVSRLRKTAPQDMLEMCSASIYRIQ